MVWSNPWLDLWVDNEFDWDCVGGKNDDIEGEEKCLLRADRELDRELPGGKNDGME